MEPSPLAQHAQTTDARCPRCHYALRGLTSDRCPECGTKLALTIVAGPSTHVPARFILWWFLALQLTFIVTEIWDIWHGYSIMQQPASGFPAFLWQVITQAPSGYVVEGALAIFAAVWLILWRRAPIASRIARWTPRVCIILLITILLLPVIDSVLSALS